MPLFCKRQADPAVSAEQMILHLSAESRLLVMCGLMDWTHGQCLPWQVLLLSPSLAGPQEVFACTQIHMLWYITGSHYLYSLSVDVSGSFHALQVKEEFVEVRGRFLELGKTTPFLIGFLFF